MKFRRDWRWLVVPRKIRKMSYMDLFQKRIAQIKASRVVCLWQPMKRLIYGETSWRKCLSMNGRLLFLRMISSNIPILWGLGTSWYRVPACNFM